MFRPVICALCLVLPPAPALSQDGDQRLEPAAANERLADLAAKARARAADLDFEAFRDRTLYLEETGKYYVNGDVPIRSEKLLREFWERNIRDNPLNLPPAPDAEQIVPEFVIMNNGGLDAVWSSDDRMGLTYCVSAAFGGRQPLVIAAMQGAAAAWEAVAALDFIHASSEDGACTNTNNRVMFDVRPVVANGRFLAAAFFPNDPRDDRSVVIDESSFQLDPNQALSLEGILRHELGHVIGARHEHTRPEAGRCFEDGNWRVVTDYDAFSVMHYPQCNGQGDWSLRLTATDKSGVACIYGPAPGFAIDPSICKRDGTPAPEVMRFGPTDIMRDEMNMVGNFPVQPGTPFRATLSGSGDPDLYVKFDSQALPSSYDCRPYEPGADETCAFPVPEGKSLVSIAVHGYEDGQFMLEVVASAPAP